MVWYGGGRHLDQFLFARRDCEMQGGRPPCLVSVDQTIRRPGAHAREEGEERAQGGWERGGVEGRQDVHREGTDPLEDSPLKQVGRRAVRDRVEQRPAVDLGGTRP